MPQPCTDVPGTATRGAVNRYVNADDPILDPAIPTRLFAATVAPGQAASVRAPLDGRPRQGQEL